jgi:hypothetical protein
MSIVAPAFANRKADVIARQITHERTHGNPPELSDRCRPERGGAALIKKSALTAVLLDHV